MWMAQIPSQVRLVMPTSEKFDIVCLFGSLTKFIRSTNSIGVLHLVYSVYIHEYG